MDRLTIHPSDNVAVVLSGSGPVERGHKVALRDIAKGEPIVKYGSSIGRAKEDIRAGEWVHTHNLETGLEETGRYRYRRVEPPQTDTRFAGRTFLGFLRPDGKTGIRNEVWIIPTVGCVNGIAQSLQDPARGIYAFPHPFGCSQLGEDHANTQKILAGLVRHPNAGAVLVLGLGCENNLISEFRKVLGPVDGDRVKFLECQSVEDEVETARSLLDRLCTYRDGFAREERPLSELTVGLKCGGSDGYSGITANPAVGVFSDLLTGARGSTLLTEVPEMFGAETLLMERCINEEVFEKTVAMINGFKEYFLRHGQVVYENPSPGNKAGGISTLEEKSLGCTQKSGSAPVVDVLAYGEPVKRKGLNLLTAPGNDLVASTALVASGSHIVLFTTGRGTPFGAPAPTVKIATNTPLYEKKGNWMDFNAGEIVNGQPVTAAGEELMEYVIRLASGQLFTRTEERGYREISLFKDGVFL